MSSFRTVKKRRDCPAGSPPAEIWTVLLHASRKNLSPGGQGIRLPQKEKLSRCLPCRWCRSSHVAFGPLEQRRWLGTTAQALLCIRATRRGP